MGKATRIRQQNAREKIAAQRAAEKRAEQRRRMFITGGAVLGVIVIVVAFILVKSMNSPTTTPTSTARTPLPASVTNNVTSVPASALATVGKGSVLTFNPAPITKVTGPPLTSNGKPEMLYIGAEYCPYCAATRWSMAVALSRFGTLSTPLHGIHSSSSDVYPDTATLTFYKTGYNSKYLAFTPVENENDQPFPAAAPPPRSRTRSGPATSQTPPSAGTRSSASGTSTCSRRRSTTRPC